MRINKIDMSHVNSIVFINGINQTIMILLAKYSHIKPFLQRFTFDKRL